MKKIEKSLIATAALALAIVGAGCFKAKETTPSRSDAGAGAVSPKTVEPKREPTQDELRAELRQVLGNFRDTKSFRANISMKTPDGDVKSKISVAKPGRLHGIIESGKDSKLELIVVDKDIYLKFNDSNWTKLVATSTAKALAETFQGTLSGKSSLDALGVDDGILIAKSYRASQNCNVYKTSLKKADGELQEVEMCVAGGFPKSLSAQTKDGPLTIEYYDYNAVFLIERPRA